MPVITVTKENFDMEVSRSPMLVVLDFWSPQCGPCMALKPRYHELAVNLKYEGKVKFCSVDTSKNRRVAVNLKVTGQPTLLFFRGGKELARLGGGSVSIENIAAKIDELLSA